MTKILKGIQIFFWLFLTVIHNPEAAGKDNVWKDPGDIDRTTVLSQHYLSKGMRLLKDTLITGTYLSDKYVASGKVVIPEGQTVTFEEGTIIFFEPKSQIDVNGTLVSKGTTSKLVRFQIANKNDLYIEPESSDLEWNGIYIGETGKLIFENVLIMNAVNGITSKAPCNSISIQQSTLMRISQTPLTILGNAVQGSYDHLFSLNCLKLKFANTKSTPETVLTKPASSTKPSNSRLVFRWTLNGVAAIGAGLTVYEYLAAQDYKNKYHSATNPGLLSDYNSKYKTSSNTSTACMIVTGAALIGLGVTFLF